MGWPLSTVDALTEREFTLWQIRGPLWPRRQELLLIQLTDLLAKVNGNKTRMSDFDMFTKSKSLVAETAALDIGNIADAGVRKLGQGRRK